MASRWLAFVVWALAGLTASAWLLQMTATPRAVPTHAVAVDTTAALRSDLSKLFGAVAAPVAEAPVVRMDSRFKLVGVVAAPSPAAVAQSMAVISVDGKPARAIRVGGVVDAETHLLAVRARAVDLGPRGGPVAATLELAPLAAAATGTLGGPSGPVGAPSMSAPALPPDTNQVPAGEMPAGQLLAPQPVPQPSAAPPPGPTLAPPMPGGQPGNAGG